MLLRTAERLLIESILHIGTTSGSDTNYRTAKLQEGIIAATNQFLREVRCSTTTTSLSLSASASSLNVSTTITAFEVSDFVSATINNYRVGLAPAGTLSRRHAHGLKTGRPTMIGFVDRTNALLDKSTDQAYTLKMTRIQIADFMPGSRGAYSGSVSYGKDDCVTSGGTSYRSLADSNSNNTPASSPTYWEALPASSQTVTDPTSYVLPLPTAWANDVIHWGARAFALMGLAGHPDAGPAMQHFQTVVIPSAKEHFARSRSGVSDAYLAAIHQTTPYSARSGGRRKG